MFVKKTDQFKYEIVISADEEYQLECIVLDNADWRVSNISSLFSVVLEHVAEHAFLSFKEPDSNGNPGSN